MFVWVSSCWAPSGELRRRAPRSTALIADVRRRQVKGDKGGGSISPNTSVATTEIPLRPVTPSPQNHPLTSGSAPEAHGPQKRVFISPTHAYACLPPFLPYFFNLCHSLSHCHTPSPSLSLRLNGGVSSKGCQAELLAGHDVPEALKWGVDLRGVKSVFYAATQWSPEI